MVKPLGISSESPKSKVSFLPVCSPGSQRGKHCVFSRKSRQGILLTIKHEYSFEPTVGEQILTVLLKSDLDTTEINMRRCYKELQLEYFFLE